MTDNGFFTESEYATFCRMVQALQKDAHSVADTIASFGAPRVYLNAMAGKYAADHALAYGEHAPESCGAWCAFPTGNERPRVAPRHSLFFDETGAADFQPDPRITRTYLTFGCTLIECGYRDFVVADDYETAKADAIAAFHGVAAH